MVPVVLLALLSVGAQAPGSHTAATTDSICVVAHVPEDGVGGDVELVRRIFLLRQRFWPDGTPARPVNLPAASPVRERFSLTVLEQSVRDLAPYWDELYFHGTRPPLSVASEAAVLLFVGRTPGAVGYVDASRVDALPSNVGRVFCVDGGAGEGPALGARSPTGDDHNSGAR